MGLPRPFKFVLLTAVLVLVGQSVAFAQLQGTLFSNDYEYREDLFEAQPGQLETLWRARIYGESTSLETQSAEVGGFDLFAESKYQLAERAEARVFLRAKFEAGRSQSFFGDIEPANGLLVREAAIKLRPLDFISLKAGVINQDWLDMPLLLARQSFPGGHADISGEVVDSVTVGYGVQYVIPTSQTLSARTMDREPSPSLITNTVYGNHKGENYSLRASYNTFDFNKLPSQVAFDSQITGNSYAFIGGPNNSAFQFDFKGWFANVGGDIQWNSTFETFGYYNIIKNNEAPETYNDGHVIGLGGKLHFEDHVVVLGYENFFAESDVVPSYYNSWIYGNTNKRGQGIDMSVQFKKRNFRVRAQFYQADVINFNGLQEDQQYFFLGVETGYDKI